MYASYCRKRRVMTNVNYITRRCRELQISIGKTSLFQILYLRVRIVRVQNSDDDYNVPSASRFHVFQYRRDSVAECEFPGDDRSYKQEYIGYYFYSTLTLNIRVFLKSINPDYEPPRDAGMRHIIRLRIYIVRALKNK